MSLDPDIVSIIDRARAEGRDPSVIHAALEQAGWDADEVFKEYANTPLKDGRLRAQVNLGDPDERGALGLAINRACWPLTEGLVMDPKDNNQEPAEVGTWDGSSWDDTKWDD